MSETLTHNLSAGPSAVPGCRATFGLCFSAEKALKVQQIFFLINVQCQHNGAQLTFLTDF